MTTAEYSDRNCITKIDCATNATEFKETTQICMQYYRHGNKILPETTNAQQSRLLGAN